MFPAEFIGRTSNHSGDSAPYSPDLALWAFCLFPKLKSSLKGKRFQTIDDIQENTTGQLMAIGRTVWGPKVPTLKGTEVSLSYVQCFLYLVSSISVSIFYTTWLGYFLDKNTIKALSSRNTILSHLYVESKKKSHRYREQIGGGCQG